MLTKGKFHTYDRSTVIDVKVTSCFPILGQNYGFTGIAVTRSFLEIKIIILRKEWATISRIFEILKMLEILRFFQHFFWQLIPQITKFSEKRNICAIIASKECMYQVSSNSVQKRFYGILNVKKMLLFRAFGRNTMQFHIFIFFLFLCNKRCSKVIFRVLDEKPTHKHVLRRQMAEIGNLTS